MYEIEKSDRCELYHPQKTSFQGMCSTGAQNRFRWWMAGGPMSLAIWPMIFRLLGHWPTGQKFQNDHWHSNDTKILHFYKVNDIQKMRDQINCALQHVCRQDC